MSERKGTGIWIGFVLAVSLLSSALTAVLFMSYYKRVHFQVLGGMCGEIIDGLDSSEEGQELQAEQIVLSAVKRYIDNSGAAAADTAKDAHSGADELSFGAKEKDTGTENILQAYGYTPEDFLLSAPSPGSFLAPKAGEDKVLSWTLWPSLCAAAGFMAGGALFLVTVLRNRRREQRRIRALTEYLEKVNSGESGLLFQVGEDEYARLQDEIYKTVTVLYQSREEAQKARNNFAENLSNIAHQLKTPITSILLSLQMVKETRFSKYMDQIRQQLARLTRLEEALLLLARIEAGTLTLERKEVDVYTLLMLAADNLQELFSQAEVEIVIPEAEEAGVAVVMADLDWTMEAVMNLMKNCMEHTLPGGRVSCAYEQNPLYTEIRIWDNGSGFFSEDIPHLFERFYRGKNAGNGGIGIGLSLSRAILESENGTISARNLPEGGACFEIRIYSH